MKLTPGIGERIEQMSSLSHERVGPLSAVAMEWWWQLLLGLWIVTPIWAGDKRLNVCMKTKHHKPEPGPEDQLYDEVQRPDLVQGSGRAASANQGRGTNAKMVSEPSSTLTCLVSQVGIWAKPTGGTL